MRETPNSIKVAATLHICDFPLYSAMHLARSTWNRLLTACLCLVKVEVEGMSGRGRKSPVEYELNIHGQRFFAILIMFRVKALP